MSLCPALCVALSLCWGSQCHCALCAALSLCWGSQCHCALQDAELLPLLGNPAHKPFTLLWPTDTAFRALPESQQRFLYRREHRDVLASYLKAHMIRDAKVSVTAHGLVVPLCATAVSE